MVIKKHKKSVSVSSWASFNKLVTWWPNHLGYVDIIDFARSCTSQELNKISFDFPWYLNSVFSNTRKHFSPIWAGCSMDLSHYGLFWIHKSQAVSGILMGDSILNSVCWSKIYLNLCGTSVWKSSCCTIKYRLKPGAGRQRWIRFTPNSVWDFLICSSHFPEVP